MDRHPPRSHHAGGPSEVGTRRGARERDDQSRWRQANDATSTLLNAPPPRQQVALELSWRWGCRLESTSILLPLGDLSKRECRRGYPCRRASASSSAVVQECVLTYSCAVIPRRRV